MTTSFSIWIDGHRIGETAFELRHGTNRHGGVFHPTEFGVSVLPGITAMGPALLDAGRMCRERGIDTDIPDLDDDTDVEMFLGAPEGTRILEAAKLIARLEVQDPSGEIVKWKSILITDVNDFAAAAARLSGAEAPAPIERDDATPVRYFISASFRNTTRRARTARWRGRTVS
jgi:hypothetical protein